MADVSREGGEGTRAEPPRIDGPDTARYARLGLHVMLLGGAVLLVALAVSELRSRGTSGVSGLTVANYRAEARADGRPAPTFEMPSLQGSGAVRLHDYAGKIVVLNFWASWCAPCRLEAPDLQRTWEDYRDRGVQFLGVDHRDERAAATAFVDEFGITYPSVFDPAGKLAFDYDLVGIPTTFVIDRGGRIVYRFLGYLQGPILRSALDDVLSGEAA